MKGLVRIWALAAAAISLPSAAHAEDWATTASTSTGIVYETDFDSLSVDGRLLRSWTRSVQPSPQKDESTGKAFVVETNERFDDCANHRFTLGTWVRRDAQGIVVSSGSTVSRGWQDVMPGTIGESISRAVCAGTPGPKEPPIQASLGDGNWTDLGPSADRKYHLQVRIDRVVKLDNGPVVAISRSIYAKPEWIDGLGVRYIVNAVAIDCASAKSAPLGADFYISPKVRVKAERLPDDKIQFQSAAPGSFLANSLKLICAAAAPPPKQDDHERGGVSVGTAWGVNKGYLVTASHVIEGGRKIWVYDNGEKVGEARVVADDPANDLAVLKFTPSKPGKITILPIAPRTAALGRSVFVLGYPAPDALGQRIKMTAGQVSSTAGYQDDARYLQIAVPIQQGNSGGPVIAWDGTVVGVVEAKLMRFDDHKGSPAPEMVNYALKSSYVRPMLEDLPDLANYTVIKPVANHDQMVAAARRAVYMVVVAP